MISETRTNPDPENEPVPDLAFESLFASHNSSAGDSEEPPAFQEDFRSPGDPSIRKDVNLNFVPNDQDLRTDSIPPHNSSAGDSEESPAFQEDFRSPDESSIRKDVNLNLVPDDPDLRSDSIPPHTSCDFVLDLNDVTPTTHSAHKPRGKPFAPGNDAGKGRPRGSRNKSTLLGRALIQEYSPMLIRKAMRMALDGNPAALKLMIERAVPPVQQDYIQVRIPSVRSSADLSKASAAVLRAASEGKIGVTQAIGLMTLIQAHCRVIETEDLARRVSACEQPGPAPADLEQIDTRAVAAKPAADQDGADAAR